MNYPRRTLVREILVSKPFTSLKELEERFPEVSSMTLRRDIEFFESQGDVIKVRKGARSMKFITTTMEESFSERLNENIDLKRKIAKKALGFIESGRSIFLDSGTTALELAKIIENNRLSIITSGPNVAIALTQNDRVMVNLLGGLLSRDNLSVSGVSTLEQVAKINIDIAFIVPSGFSLKDGFTCGNYNECELKQAIIAKAEKTVMLLDSQKIGKSLPYTFAELGGASAIITDSRLDPAIRNAAQEKNIEIIIAE